MAEGMKCWSQKLESLCYVLPDGESRVILRSLVLMYYQRVTDRHAACNTCLKLSSGTYTYRLRT